VQYTWYILVARYHLTLVACILSPDSSVKLPLSLAVQPTVSLAKHRRSKFPNTVICAKSTNEIIPPKLTFHHEDANVQREFWNTEHSRQNFPTKAGTVSRDLFPNHAHKM